MTQIRKSLILAAAVVSWTFVAHGAAPISYPSQGQSLDQQANNEAACRTFGQQQSGFDPSMPPPSSSPPPPSGQILRGSARGSALGAVGGAIAGDAGKGAAIGAGVGATAGLMRRGQQRASASQQQQTQAQYNAERDGYTRAFAACMQGRGYSVR